MSNQEPIKLKIPRQELDACQFFACEEEAVRRWVDQLPVANIGQTTRQLYQALAEFNQVRVLPAKRMAILELLRPKIYYVTRSLARHYLNQPLVLSEQPRKVAELTHTLNRQLASGYAIVATHTAALGRRSGQFNPDTLIARALHRAITGHTLNILRHYQLYQPVDEDSWHTLHQFYRLASRHKLSDRNVEDTEFGDCTVAGSYLRALLLGCSKPNQLRQEDFTSLFRPLTDWAQLCELRDSGEALFAIDPDGDKPPVYRELYESVLPPHWIGLYTGQLAERLRQLMDASTADSVTVTDKDHTLSRDLVGHLLLAWSTMSKRCFMRLEADDSLDLCIGLSATHHFVSGELSFEALVEERGAKTYTMIQENPFLKAKGHVLRQKDVWDSPYEANVGKASVAIETVDFHIRTNQSQSGEDVDRKKYRCHQVEIVNSSAHGYCIAWPEGVEALIKPGEIVGVRESNSHNWSIGAIRWVHRNGLNRTQIGLELISPSASPYGARIIRKTGAPGEYMRVLVLPELPVTKQPVSLLTPRVPFKQGVKVVLNQRGKEVQVRLDRKLNEAGAYNQFLFHRVSGTHTNSANGNKGDESLDDFDSIWGNL